MRTPTIAQIKQATRVASPHFFDRATLRFFGQTMRAFKVRRSPGGRVFIFAPRQGEDRYYDPPVHLAGYTFREYVNNDLVLPRNDDGTLADTNNTLAEVLRYIEEH